MRPHRAVPCVLMLLIAGGLVATPSQADEAPTPVERTLSSPNWTAEADQDFAYFGISVASAGDVNGDGYDDVIVGALDYDNGQSDEGRAFAYYGSATGPSTTPNWTAESDQDYAYFGYSVAGAGDVNGDGYDDVIVGADSYSNGQIQEGRAFAYYGSAAGLSTDPNWTAESNQVFSFFGYSVAGAGDVNGDGFDEVIVGASSFDNGQSSEGRAFAYHGSAAGLSTTPSWTAESDQEGANFGYSVAGAGDVNGDGFDEVIVGASSYSNGQSSEGRAFAYHGSAAGLSLDPNWTAESDQGSAFFGNSVAGAGDVNGDGYDEVIVGAWAFDNGQTDEGRAFAYHGSAAGLNTIPNWTAEANQSSAYSGWSVAGAGDVNGDGFDEVIVGAWFYDHGQTDEGRSSVFCGTATGLEISPCRRGESNQASAQFGVSVAGAGDVNGDGFDDRIVGASNYDHGQTDEGVAVVKYGSPD